MLAAGFIGCVPFQRLMNTVMVVVLYERVEFSLQILSIPKEETVKVFTTNRPYQSFNEGMRCWCIRNGLNFLDFKDS